MSIAQEAWMIALEFQRKWFETREKTSALDLVTEADTYLDSYIRNALESLMPWRPIWSEENDQEPESLQGYTWIVDPIDGTYDFVHGSWWRSILIGLAKDGIPYAGIMAIPVSWKIFAAIAWYWYVSYSDEDSFCIYAVSDIDSLDTSTVHYSLQTERYLSWSQKDLLTDTVKVHNSTQNVHFEGILQWDIEGSFFLREGCGPWDVCAPAVLLQEAWGMITTLQWQQFDFSVHKKFWFVASNGVLHDELVWLIKMINKD